MTVHLSTEPLATKKAANPISKKLAAELLEQEMRSESI